MSPELEAIAVEFPTPAQTMAALKDIDGWLKRRNRGASLYTRRRGDSPNVTLVIAVVLADSPHRGPIVSRLRRKGGQLTEIPDDLEQKLIDDTRKALDEAAD